MSQRKCNCRMVHEVDTEYMERLLDGTVRPGLRITVCDHRIEGMKTGYCCVNCGEWVRDDQGAYPDECICGFPMKERQAETFAAQYAGWRPMGPSFDWDEEMERLERQRVEREWREGARAKGIVLPRGLN